MKIVIVTEVFLPTIDGLVLRLSEAIKHFCKEGHEVLVITGKRSVAQFQNVPVYSVAEMQLPFGKKLIRTPSNNKMNGILSIFAPQVIHVVNPAGVGTAAINCAKQLDIPYIVSFHTNYENMLKQTHFNYKFIEKKIWANRKVLADGAAMVLTTSNMMRKTLAAHGIEGAHVLKRGVDLEKRRPDYRSKEMRTILCKGETDKKLLVYIGGLSEIKNLEALVPMMRRRDDVCLAIVGDGEYKEALENAFRGTRTVFTGYLRDKDLSEAYATADAFIFPSLKEHVGLTLLEAMASGVPTIAAYSTLTKEQLHDGIDCMLYPSGDEKALDAAIDRLNDKESLKKMRLIALREAHGSSWENASQQLLDYYSIVKTRATKFNQ